MDCREIRELLSDYLDGRLAPAQASSLEEHLRGCRGCKQEMEALRTTISLIASLGEVETSPDFLSQVQRKIDKQERPWRIWAWLFEPIRVKVPLEITALILLSFGALHLYYRSPELSREPRLPAPSEHVGVARDQSGKELPAERDRQTTKGAGRAAKPEPQRALPKSSELSEKASQGEVADFSRRAAPPSAVQSSKVTGEKAEDKTLEAQGKSEEGDKLANKRAMTPAAEPPKEARDEMATARMSEVYEISTDDVDLLEAKIKALLAKSEGKLLTQEGTSGSELLLTVELPQRRQAEFLAALQEVDRESKLSGFEKGAISGSKNQLQQKRSQFGGSAAGTGEAPAGTSSIRTDESTVRLQLRILPKH